MADHKTAACLAIATALAGCTIETSYTPRTRGRLALAMRNGEPGVYKDGVLSLVSAGPGMAMACSPAAAGEAIAAADQHRSYQTDMQITGIIYALSVFAPPAFGLAAYFNVLAADHQQKSFVHIVDAINRHNDEPACIAAAVAAAGAP